MYILGINAYHPNSSACIVKDGQLLAAAEEERFLRIKHWAGFPAQAIRYCLQEAGIEIREVDYIAVSRDPLKHFHKKVLLALYRRLPASVIGSRLKNIARIKGIRDTLCLEFGIAPGLLKARIYNIEHHLSHIASSFLVSDLTESGVLTIDAMGDFVSTMWGRGRENRIKISGRVEFPHSLGFLYSAATQFLGFLKFGDEFKVMGLAAYGNPVFADNFRKILKLGKVGGFKLAREYFNFYSKGLDMLWDGEAPKAGILYSDKWKDEFGEVRQPSDALEQRHKDIAASLQVVLEEAYFYLLGELYRKTKMDKLCLAGGVALNCVANGKIFESTPFKQMYIQPAANDAGTCIGAAFYVYNRILKYPRGFVMRHACWGPEYSDTQIQSVLEKGRVRYTKLTKPELVKAVAVALAEGNIVGWFQGRMEWGPRSLGNRSILADPRRADMKDILNARVKHREPFRPFAPSILEEYIEEYFGRSISSPFMLVSLPVKKERLEFIVASAHVDGSARFQSVSRKENTLFWGLIEEFRKLTGVPALLNTSFNENEPIVCRPEEALDCFLRTKMDILAIGSYLIRK